MADSELTDALAAIIERAETEAIKVAYRLQPADAKWVARHVAERVAAHFQQVGWCWPHRGATKPGNLPFALSNHCRAGGDPQPAFRFVGGERNGDGSGPRANDDG